MKKHLSLSLIFSTIVIYSCGTSSSSKEIASDTIDTLLSPTLEQKSPAGNWSYWENTDKMTSKSVYHAQVNGKEELQFEFPYQGGAVASIYLRNKDNKNDAVLMVSKGQFNSSIEGQTIRVRFDDGSPVMYNCNPSSDGDPKFLFVQSTKGFINKLKSAKKVIVEAEFYNEGLRQMEFVTDGLKWSH